METLFAGIDLDAQALTASLKIRPGSADEAAFLALLAEAQAVARPKAVYTPAFIDSRQGERLVVAGVAFTSAVLVKNLAGINRIFPYIATCGTEVDAVQLDSGDLLAAYWLNAIKIGFLRNAIELARKTVQQRYQIEKISAMNPGSADADVWPIEQQTELFQLLDPASIGVVLTPSYLMVPEMSVSGIFFPTDSEYVNCQLCQREHCPGRRAPFDCDLWAAINA